MSETRRLVSVAELTVCEGRHVTEWRDSGRKAWQIRCPRCQGWAWEDGYFCPSCGTRLKEA